MRKISEVLYYVLEYLSNKDLDDQTYVAYKLLEELYYNYSEELDEIYKVENSYITSYLDEIKDDYLLERCNDADI